MIVLAKTVDVQKGSHIGEKYINLSFKLEEDYICRVEYPEDLRINYDTIVETLWGDAILGEENPNLALYHIYSASSFSPLDIKNPFKLTALYFNEQLRRKKIEYKENYNNINIRNTLKEIVSKGLEIDTLNNPLSHTVKKAPSWDLLEYLGAESIYMDGEYRLYKSGIHCETENFKLKLNPLHV